MPSGYYFLLKLASQLSSLYSTDIREALVGVGLVVKNERSGIATLDKGISAEILVYVRVCVKLNFQRLIFRSHAFLPQSLLLLIRIILP